MLLHLRNGGAAVIDDDLYEATLSLEVWEGQFFDFRICDMKWRHKDHERVPYVQSVVQRDKKLCCIRLHRLIMQAAKGSIVDHIDRDVLNNCRSNLRVTDHFGNNRNRSKQQRRNGIYTNPLTGELIQRTKTGGKPVGVTAKPGRWSAADRKRAHFPELQESSK